MPQKHYFLRPGFKPLIVDVYCRASDETLNRVASFNCGPAEGSRALAAFTDGALRRGDTVSDFAGVMLQSQPDA